MMAVPMSSTKANFMHHIGLNPVNPQSTRVYEAMMGEAEYQFKELTSNNTNAVDPARGPPYKWADIQRSRKDMAVAWIRQNASAVTSRYYELGDWVIIWCLYTVFRNRDGRRDNTIQQRQCVEDNPRVFNATMGGEQTCRRFYDTIRDEFR